MKTRRLTRVALVAALLTSVAVAGYGQPYTDVHVFGDSRADVGNNYFLSGGSIPPSPPYWQGRFSYGPVFPEVVADNFNLEPLTPSRSGGTDYAHGGALVLEDLWGGLIPSVRSQVESHLGGVGVPSKTLYLLEGGGNDLSAALELPEWDDAQTFVETSARGMVESFQMLAAREGAHAVILNVAYASESYWHCGNVDADALADVFNATLEEGLSALNGDLRIVYFDLATFARTASEHFITGCEFCVPFLGTDVLCSDPDVLFYWDFVHFSAPVHQLIGDAITVAILHEEVQHLRATGILSKGRANALLSKLDGAYEKLAERKPKTAVNKVRAFANQVKAFVRSGRLAEEQAELLLVGAHGIIDQP